jgi:hypothetical protein
MKDLTPTSMDPYFHDPYFLPDPYFLHTQHVSCQEG